MDAPHPRQRVSRSERADLLLAHLGSIPGLTRRPGFGAGDIAKRLADVMSRTHVDMEWTPSTILATLTHLEDAGLVRIDRTAKVLQHVAAVPALPAPAPPPVPESPSMDDLWRPCGCADQLAALQATLDRIAGVCEALAATWEVPT